LDRSAAPSDARKNQHRNSIAESIALHKRIALLFVGIFEGAIEFVGGGMYQAKIEKRG
jgi:membrane protein involved in colicin uptake